MGRYESNKLEGYYFEIAGKPGKMYLDKFQFGRIEVVMEGRSSPMVSRC